MTAGIRAACAVAALLCADSALADDQKELAQAMDRLHCQSEKAKAGAAMIVRYMLGDDASQWRDEAIAVVERDGRMEDHVRVRGELYRVLAADHDLSRDRTAHVAQFEDKALVACLSRAQYHREFPDKSPDEVLMATQGVGGSESLAANLASAID
jgi:hypothetical protein